MSIAPSPPLGPHAYVGTAVSNVVFDMVDRCNLVCPSCYHGIHGGTKRTMDLATCKEVLDHCVKYFAPKMLWPFNWAEPFVCEQLADFITLFSHYPMRLALSSNMNRSVPDELIEHVLRHTNELTLSVSALDQEVYRKYHRGGKIEEVIANIRRFVAIRDRIGSKTTFLWSFGRNRFNASQEGRIRQFCDENRIALFVNRYYVTDAEDVQKVLDGGSINPKIYQPFHESQEDLRAEIAAALTPQQCGLLATDIVVDVDGYLMLCTATKKSTKTHITEIRTIEQLVASRLDHAFCRDCFDSGIVGYFRADRAQQPPRPSSVVLGESPRIKRTWQRLAARLVGATSTRA